VCWVWYRNRKYVECVLPIVLCVRSLGEMLFSTYKSELIGSESKLGQAVWNRGTEMRLKRFIAKAQRGEGFTVGVVGGSGTSLSPVFTVSSRRSTNKADGQYPQDTVYTSTT
jgi:hypothetical protein